MTLRGRRGPGNKGDTVRPVTKWRKRSSDRWNSSGLLGSVCLFKNASCDSIPFFGHGEITKAIFSTYRFSCPCKNNLLTTTPICRRRAVVSGHQLVHVCSVTGPRETDEKRQGCSQVAVSGAPRVMFSILHASLSQATWLQGLSQGCLSLLCSSGILHLRGCVGEVCG